MQSESSIQSVHKTYQSLMKEVTFDQIEHVPNQFFQKEISVEENCLCISYQYFSMHYEPLMKELSRTTPEQLQQNHWIAQVLLVMNGENSNAWNHKKAMLNLKLLDIQRQLKFNAAVCYKNKKSSTYYEYRIRLFEELVKTGKSKQELLSIYQDESKLIWKILARFLRNYFCWMYRNRLLKLFEGIIGQEVTQLQIKLLHKYIGSHPNDHSAYSRLIPIIKNSSVDIAAEIEWVQDLEDFCSVAFQSKESFRHINTYKKFLKTLENSTK